MKQHTQKNRPMSTKKRVTRSLAIVLLLVVLFSGSVALIGALECILAPAGELGELVLCMPILFLSFFLPLIISTGGTLAGGLANGYNFCSIRMFNLLFVRRQGRIVCKQLRAFSIDCQCLMSPPVPYHENTPFLLYHLGAPLSTFFFSFAALALLFLGFGRLFTLPALALTYLMCFSGFGLIITVANSLPFRIFGQDTPMSNALFLKKSPVTRYVACAQLYINAQIDGGARLKDLPDELFVSPGPLDVTIGFHSSFAAYSCMRTLDKGDYQAAPAQMDALLAAQPKMVHRDFLVRDRIFCGYLLGQAPEAFEHFYTPQFKLFLNKAQGQPATQRLLYAEARLVKRSMPAAYTVLAQFEAVVKNYPTPHEIKAEREHLAAVDAECARQEAALQSLKPEAQANPKTYQAYPKI